MQFIEGMRHLSPGELGMLGMADLAYIKPVLVEGTEAFTIEAVEQPNSPNPYRDPFNPEWPVGSSYSMIVRIRDNDGLNSGGRTRSRLHAMQN